MERNKDTGNSPICRAESAGGRERGGKPGHATWGRYGSLCSADDAQLISVALLLGLPHIDAMRKRIQGALAILGVMLVTTLVCCVAALVLRARGPVVNGRPLDYWLKRLETGRPAQAFLPGSNSGGQRLAQQAQASDAIRRLGTNSLPSWLLLAPHRRK